MEKKEIALQAYNRFILAIQNKLIEGDFLITPEVFIELMGGES